MSPKQSSVELPVMTTPKKSPWDTQADKYALSANEIGKTVPQIATELCAKGYAASTVEVYESLSRQSVNVSMEWTAVAGVSPTLLLPWDSRADAITFAAHQLGHSPLQLLAELRWAGYSASIEKVAASYIASGVHRL